MGTGRSAVHGEATDAIGVKKHPSEQGRSGKGSKWENIQLVCDKQRVAILN